MHQVTCLTGFIFIGVLQQVCGRRHRQLVVGAGPSNECTAGDANKRMDGHGASRCDPFQHHHTHIPLCRHSSGYLKWLFPAPTLPYRRKTSPGRPASASRVARASVAAGEREIKCKLVFRLDVAWHRCCSGTPRLTSREPARNGRQRKACIMR